MPALGRRGHRCCEHRPSRSPCGVLALQMAPGSWRNGDDGPHARTLRRDAHWSPRQTHLVERAQFAQYRWMISESKCPSVFGFRGDLSSSRSGQRRIVLPDTSGRPYRPADVAHAADEAFATAPIAGLPSRSARIPHQHRNPCLHPNNAAHISLRSPAERSPPSRRSGMGCRPVTTSPLTATRKARPAPVCRRKNRHRVPAQGVRRSDRRRHPVERSERASPLGTKASAAGAGKAGTSTVR